MRRLSPPWLILGTEFVRLRQQKLSGASRSRRFRRNEMDRPRAWVRKALLVLWWTAALLCSSARADEPVLLVRMPDEPALTTPPTDDEIARFFAQHGRFLHMTAKDLARDRELARQVLGQRQIFDELAIFEATYGVSVKVRFISWADAFRYFADYVSDASNPPVVAQLGDTWAAYFRSLGVMPHERRHTWDVRLLWYWRDQVTAERVMDAAGMIATCQQIQRAAPPELAAPLALPTAPDWNLLHDLSVWLYNAGLPSLISTEPKFGLVPWKEAVFDGPEGERAARFLIDLTKRGCVALPEKTGTQLAEDFLARRYAMVILGPWFAERAAAALGPGWRDRIGATLPPSIGAPAATTFKGGSLLVVLDPTRGQEPNRVERARQLVEFFVSPESQQRYTRALGALPATPQALAASPDADLFRPALERGRAYPQIPEWAPVVENLTTRDNLYAFWKRLSLLADAAQSTSDLEARERLILAALHSAAADINAALSPGRAAFLWPWLIALGLLACAASSMLFWQRRRELARIRELREARDALATLERRLAAAQEQAATTSSKLVVDGEALSKGYPALYLDAVRRKVLIRTTPSAPLEEIIHGAEFDLFRHIVECLQVGWHETHWTWSYVIWPTAQPKHPKEAFATHCAKLRKKIEKSWQLGKMLGRGSHHDGSIPIEVRDVHFYTDAVAEGDAHPVWSIFQISQQALNARKAEQWDEAAALAEQLLRLDPDNWSANLLLCDLVARRALDPSSPTARAAVAFARKQMPHYARALNRIEELSDDRIGPDQRQRLGARLETLRDLLARLPETAPTPMLEERRPWRTRDQFNAWASYLGGNKGDLPRSEIRLLKEVERFVAGRLHWANPHERDELFRAFIQDLALDATLWPEEKLPASETTLKYRALDYVLAGLCRLSDDDDAKAVTKAQNLRKLWGARAELRRLLAREPTTEELFAACQQRFGWSRQSFERWFQIERACRPYPVNDRAELE